MNSKTWIVYKTSSADATGWESRQLQPSGAGTDILWENWDWSGRDPQIGDRTEVYANLEDPGNGATHSKLDDWVVTQIEQFKSEHSDERVIICYCTYSPIEATWQQLRRGAPVTELMANQLVS